MTTSLKEARRRAGLTQVALAGMSGVSPTLLGFSERGRYTLSVSQAQRLANAIGVDVDEVDELAAAKGRRPESQGCDGDSSRAAS